MFFLRNLKETGHHLGPILVNQVHPDPGPAAGQDPGTDLLRFLADRDRRGLRLLRSLFPGEKNIISVPLEPVPPGNLRTLGLLFDKLSKAAPA